jgi:hypothetical protein
MSYSYAPVQVDRATDFLSPSKKVGTSSQKEARLCRVEAPPIEGDTLFVYFIVSRRINLYRESYFS